MMRPVSPPSPPLRRRPLLALPLLLAGRPLRAQPDEPVRLPRRVEVAFNAVAFRCLAPPPDETLEDRTAGDGPNGEPLWPLSFT